MITIIKYLAVFVVGYFIGRIPFTTSINKNHDQFTITKLTAGADGESYFEEVTIDTDDIKPLGKYSKKFKVEELYFRNSRVAKPYDFHTAPQQQYIIYLSGTAEVETSLGEKKSFKAGDILLASDTSGKGHRSTITKDGRALILTVE